MILYYPDIEERYPDFTTGDYTLKEIEDFAEKYSLKLNTKYVDDTEHPAGTIIAQSRQAGSRIAAGATFTITITQEPIEEEIPGGDLSNE